MILQDFALSCKIILPSLGLLQPQFVLELILRGGGMRIPCPLTQIRSAQLKDEYFFALKVTFFRKVCVISTPSENKSFGAVKKTFLRSISLAELNIFWSSKFIRLIIVVTLTCNDFTLTATLVYLPPLPP